MSGLLQFATQIVFCDQIFIGGRSFNFDSGVAERSEAITDDLLRLGVESHLLSTKQISRNQWELLCMRAAAELADEVQGVLVGEITKFSDLLPELKSFTIPTAQVHDLISRDRSTDELEERAGIAGAGGMASVTEYCIAGCDELWKVLRAEYRAQGGWAMEQTMRLQVLLWVQVNSLVGQEFGAIYSPAVPRAIMFRESSNVVEEMLSRMVLDAARKIAPRQLGVPSLGMALIRGSDGKASNIIESALEFRTKARLLRELLAPLAERISCGDEEGAYQLALKVSELSKLLEQDLGLTDTPKLFDALEMKFILGLPSPSLNARGVVNWIEYKRKRRRVAVLTDLSKTLAFRSSLNREYLRLIRKSTH